MWIDRQSAPATRDNTGAAMFDQAIFAEIRDALPAAALLTHLRILIASCEALLAQLRDAAPQSPAPGLAEAAHKLAGGAGTFGFLATAAAARAFVTAADTGAANTGALADRLAATIEDALVIARNKLDGADVTSDMAASPPA